MKTLCLFVCLLAALGSAVSMFIRPTYRLMNVYPRSRYYYNDDIDINRGRPDNGIDYDNGYRNGFDNGYDNGDFGNISCNILCVCVCVCVCVRVHERARVCVFLTLPCLLIDCKVTHYNHRCHVGIPKPWTTFGRGRECVCVCGGVCVCVGGGGGMSPTFGSVCVWGDRISDAPPPPFWDGNKSRISIFICVLRSFLLDLSRPHVLTPYPYLNILSMYSIYRMRERHVLFNDALNTFYLRLYGVRHMVKDHSDSEKGNPLPPHRLLLSINSKGSFICTIPQTG